MVVAPRDNGCGTVALDVLASFVVKAMDLDKQLTVTLESLRPHVPERLLSTKIGIVCGSGLSTLAETIRDKHEVPYSVLAGFGESTGKDPLYFGLDSIQNFG